MTNEELLQQAKDQVAQKHIEKFENWSALRMACRSAGKEFLIQAFLEDASLLAIQSAREEAAKEFKEYKEHCEHLAQQIRMLGECRTDQIKTAREETVSTKIKFDWFEKGYRACEQDTSADEKWNPSKAFRKEIEN